MYLNITKDAYEILAKKRKNIQFGFLIGSTLSFGFLALFVSIASGNPTFNPFQSMLIGLFTGFLLSLPIAEGVIELLPSLKILDTPFSIFNYFEQKDEKVLSCDYLRNGYYEVKTDKDTYLCEMFNGFVSAFAKEKPM